MTHLPLPGRYYDGRSALAHDVTVKVASYGVDIVAAGGNALLARWPRAGLMLGGSIAEHGAVTLTSGDAPDARLLLSDPAAARSITQLLPQAAAAHRRHSRRTVGIYSAITIGLVALGAGIVHWLPEIAAPLIPFETKRSVGLASVDSWFYDEGRCIAPEGKAALDGLAERLRQTAGIGEPLNVIVVDHPMINAFALPGGTIVLMRGLIKEAGGPNEVAGVLAHEIGHVKYDHPTVGMLRTMGISAMLQLLTGGTGVESLAEAGGGLLWLSYSRGAEEQADRAGIEMLEQAGLHAGGMSRFFLRLEAKEAGNGFGLPGWLSTHPSTEERRKATERPAGGADALDPDRWHAVQSMCDIRE